MRSIFRHGARCVVPLGSAFLMLFTGAASDVGAAQGDPVKLTAAVGSTTSGGQPLDPRAGLGEGSDLETGDDGGCSLIVDEDALMELCGNTRLKLERKGPDGPRVVKLDRGEIRMVVEPRLGEERIEIHTPAAIATILGTILHVSVDALGVTTVTSVYTKSSAPKPGEGRASIESSSTGVTGTTTIEPGERVVIQPGEPPAAAERLDPKEIAAVGGCLIDFHDVTLSYDRGKSRASKVDQVVTEALADARLADISAPGAPGPPPVERDITATENEDVLDQVATGSGDSAIAEIIADSATGAELLTGPAIPGVDDGSVGGEPNPGPIPGVP